MNWRALLKVVAFSVVAFLMAAMEVGTLTGPDVGDTEAYHAMFGAPDGVSGLRAGNQVRAAGVPVGKVTAVDLVDATHARVTFTANDNQTLTTTTWAVVRYADLLGQRYLALTRSGGSPGTPLPHGATIPVDRTRPALSLTALFNGFRPLFSALTPDQVNELAQDIIAILQGQSGRVADLVSRTASLTTHLANRNALFGTVLDSLSTLLRTVSSHDDDLAGLLQVVSGLTTKLHAQGPAILGSLDAVDSLAGSVTTMLSRLEEHNLTADVADLEHVTGAVAEDTGTVRRLVDGFVTAFGDFSRVTQNGSFVNAYLCQVGAKTIGTAQFTLGQGVGALGNLLGNGTLTQLLNQSGLASLALLQLPVQAPVELPNGPAGASGHTAVCR